MADEKQLTAEEIIIGLRGALQYYANPNQNQGHDLCLDPESFNFNESGERARKALEEFQFVDTVPCSSVHIEVGDVTIISKNNSRRENTAVYFDRKFQRGIQSVKFEADVDALSKLTIKRVPVEGNWPGLPDLPAKETE